MTRDVEGLTPFTHVNYASELGLGPYYAIEYEKYNHRPYLDANYWFRFDKWLIEHDVVWDATNRTFYFKSPEHRTMFLLTYPPV